MTKAELRKKCREISNNFSTEYRELSSREISRKVLQSDFFKNAKSVFIYVSTEFEPDTTELILSALEKNKKVYVPRCVGIHQMEIVKITDLNDLRTGTYNLLEPKDELTETADDVDLSIIPCVGVSRDGDRLGHGGGYYDVFLQKSKSTKMCLCFKKLVLDLVPTEVHDIKPDIVITE